MEIKNVQKQKGFTLVEIAIVLVIIGLLLGGVLKGQELITNAKIKAVTSDFDNISAAYYAYQDRTGNIAGDYNATTTKYDGILADARTWFDLRTEGFISGAPVDGTTDSGPTHDLDGVWTALPGGNVVAAGTAGTALFTKNHICASNVPDSYAQGMDIKMDDGNPATGTIRSATMAAQKTLLATYAGNDTLNTICKEL